MKLNDFVHDGFSLPRWAWRSLAAAITVGLLVTGEVAGALGAIVAFAAAEVVFDAAEQER